MPRDLKIFATATTWHKSLGKTGSFNIQTHLSVGCFSSAAKARVSSVKEGQKLFPGHALALSTCLEVKIVLSDTDAEDE